MALDFNTTPYYDDFEEDKNFHRILFRPGRAVQARELTQSQTVLQDQLKKFGDHIFKDGSRVTGASLFSIGEGRFTQTIDVNSQTSVNHINLQSTFGGTAINVSSFIGNYVSANTGANTGVATDKKSIYFVHHADVASGSDPDTIYVSFIRTTNVSSNGSSNNNIPTVTSIVPNSANLQIFSTSDLNPTNLISTVTATNNLPYGRSKLMGVTDGVFFTNGVFVKNTQQVIAVDKYGANTNATIGFDVTESIVKSTDDTTLLDPALDSSNYLAPGGDRYKISLDLSRKNLDSQNSTLPSLTSTKYIELVRYRNGLLVKDTSGTVYSDLARTLARRTFDESGDYIVEGLEPRISALGNSASFILNIGRGKAYVKGYEINQLSQLQLPVSRARDQESITGHDVETSYGNFIHITSSNNAIFNSNVSERVELYSSNSVIDGTTKIAEGYVKNLEYVSGSAEDSVYKLFLFDVKRLANTGGKNLPIALTKHIKAPATSRSANCNVQSLSIVTHETAGSVVNATQHLLVSNPTGIRIGDEVFGHNVSEDLYSNERRVYVTDIQGSNIALTNTSVSKETTNNFTFRRATFTDTNKDIGVFESSYDVISSVNDVNYNTRRVFRDVLFENGTATLTSNDGTERFKNAGADQSLKEQFYQVIIRSTSGSQVANAAVDLSDSGVSFFTVSTPGNPDSLTVDINDSGFNGTADVLTTIDITSAARRSKTSNSHFKLFTEIGNAATSITRSLGVTDVINVTAIYISNNPSSTANSSNNDVKDLFIIDTGQRDSYYDHATIKLKESGVGQVNTGQVNVVYNRFVHTGVGHFDANSYPIYEDIPQHITKSGIKIDLRDSIDFRPTRSADETSNVFSNTNMTFDRNQTVDSRTAVVDTDLSYYLSRIDKVVLSYDKQFRVIRGVSALTNPGTPIDDPDSMTLYKLTFPPFTYDTSNVIVDIVKNRRYTMKDIGGLDDRISRVEYYTSLNLLEQEISSSSFFNNDNVQLINNGFLVDDFRGHSVGDVLNPDYKCSIDYTDKVLHPRFSANATNVAITVTGLADSTNVLSVPFTTSVYAAQNVSSSTTNINPFNVVSFIGHVRLKADVTTYADFLSRPGITVNKEGHVDNYAFGINFAGSEWDQWTTLAYNSDTTRIYSYYDTEGQRVKQTSSAEEAGALTTKTENSKVYYYMAPHTIEFEIFGFRPNTFLFCWIDNVHVSSKLRAFNSDTGDFGSSPVIVTDDQGFAKGLIQITDEGGDTNRLFTTGEHLITFVDSFDKPNLFSTIATTTYFAGTPQSKLPPPVEPEPEEPAALEPVDNNCFFYWDIINNNPGCDSLERRNRELVIHTEITQATIDAHSGTVVAAYRDVLGRTPDRDGYAYWLLAIQNGEVDLNVGPHPTAGFTGLGHYFANGKEFTDGRQYCMFGRDPLAQTFFVNENVNPKGIFVSAIDIFFSSKDGTLPVTLELRTVENGYPTEEIILGSQVTLNPDDIVIPATATSPEPTRFTFDRPIFLEPDQYSMVLLTNSSDYNVYIATVGATRLDTGQSVVGQPYLGSLFKSQNASTWTADQESDLCFVIHKCVFDTSGTFTSILEPQKNNLPLQNIDLLRFDAPIYTFDKTNINFKLGVKANGSTNMDAAIDLEPNSDVYFQNRKIFDASNDANITVEMSTTNEDLSPIFEMNRSRVVFIEHLINSSSNTEVTARPETLASDGGASSKYITKKVTLSEGFDATDLRVIISKNLPVGASVEVYFRVQNDLDTSSFTEIPFQLMTQVTPSVVSQSNYEYYDCEYKAENITYSSQDIEYDSYRYFQVKIVLFSNNTANAPTVKNLRAIALS